MSTYMNKVVGNLEQTRTGFTTQERTTARQNIDLKASLFTSSDNSLNFEDLDNDTKQINVTSDAYSLTSNTGINIVPNDTDKTIAINHVTTTAADAAIVRVGKDVYGHVVLGTAITAADFKAVTYTDAKKTTDSDKYIYLLNGVATEGRIVLDVNPTNSGLKLDSSKYIQVNCGTNLAIGTDGKLNNTYTYTLPVASANNLGGIKIGYTTPDNARKYAVELDTSNKAYVNVPWTDTLANNGTLTIPVVTTSMKDGGGWVCTTTTKTFTADQSTDTTFTTALAEYNHSHGALNYTGTLGYAPYCTAMGSAYIAANPSNNVSLVLTTGSYITKSDITFNSSYPDRVLTQAGTWVDRLTVASADKLGGIKIGYTSSGKNYAVQLDSSNKAYVNVPWEAANNGTLTIPYVTTSMENGGGWVCTPVTKTFTANQSTDTTFTTALAAYNHSHGALNYTGTLGYAPYCTSMGSAYIASTSNTVSLVLTTGSYITKSDISFLAGSNKILTQAGTWVDQYSYTLPAATSSALGGIKIGYTTSGKNYPVQLNSTNQAYVNVPWTDTHYLNNMYVTTKNGTSDQYIAADSTNKIYLALYDDTILRSQHKIYGDGTIIKISSEAESGAGAAIKIDGSHNHGLLAQNGTLGQQSGFPSGTISSYLTGNTSAKIEIPLAMTYKLTDSAWSTEYELTRGGIALSANGTRYLKEDGSWGTPNTHLYFGRQNATANSKQENGNVYMTLTDESTVRHSYNIIGSGGTTVTSDANGNITINSVNMDALSITRESASIPSTGTVDSIAFKTTVVNPKTHLTDDTLDVTYTYQTTDPATNTPVTATNTETFAFINPANQTTGIYANTDAYGTIHTINVADGLELYDSEDSFSKFAYLRLKTDHRTIAIDNYSEIAFATGGVEFQGSIPSNTYRYAKVCTLIKTRKLTGASANLNASFLVTYSGTDNTNPSLINISARIQGSTSSGATDVQKYGINKFNFTETRSNSTNKGITLYAQAYVTDSLQLVIDIYAKTSENWHGLKLTQLHAGGTYSIKYSDGTGAYDIKYYGPDSQYTSPLIETATEPEKPSNVYSSDTEYFHAQDCVSMDYSVFDTWNDTQTYQYIYAVYGSTSQWQKFNYPGGSSIGTVDTTAQNRIRNMTTAALDIGGSSDTPGALVLRSLDYNGNATVKTFLYTQSNYVTYQPNTMFHLQLPIEQYGTLATQSYVDRSVSDAITSRQAKVPAAITTTVPIAEIQHKWNPIHIGEYHDGYWDMTLELTTNIIRPSNGTSYIGVSSIKVDPGSSHWGQSGETTTFMSFGYTHGYTIRSEHNRPMVYKLESIHPTNYDPVRICDYLLAPQTQANTSEGECAPSYAEVIIKASSSKGNIALRLNLQLTSVKCTASTTVGYEKYELRLAYAYEYLSYNFKS